jgi:lipopolysaccharide transport system permease protein
VLSKSIRPAAEDGQRAAPKTARLQQTSRFGRILSRRDLWLYRNVALQLAIRDVKVRYRQTALGVAWAVLQPLLMMGVFAFLFGRLAHVSSDGHSYALFTLVALVPWTYFANSLTVGSDSLVNNTALVSKIYFPRIFIPAGVVAAGLVDLCIGLVLLFIAVLGFGVTLTAKALLLPAFICIAIAAALGATSGLSAINVRYRDVRYAVPFAVQFGLFATPIAYSVTLLHEPWRTLVAINPMVGVVEGFRWALLGDSAAPAGSIALSAASALVLLVLGFAYFSRVERHFADII